MIEINPKYEIFSEWLRCIPDRFEETGTIIYNARNQVRKMCLPDNTDICVKRYRRPIFINRYVYRYFRASKAKRAYNNGLFLLSKDVATPEPVAFIENYSLCGLDYSYLITRMSTLKHLNREFTMAYREELDETIRPLAQFTAHMHDNEILPLDYSPGNILWDTLDGKYQFEIIDINRMKFCPVDLKTGCRSMQRICAKSNFFDIFADEYAKVRNLDPTQCHYWIHYYRNKFWHNGKKAYYQYD